MGWSGRQYYKKTLAGYQTGWQCKDCASFHATSDKYCSSHCFSSCNWGCISVLVALCRCIKFLSADSKSMLEWQTVTADFHFLDIDPISSLMVNSKLSDILQHWHSTSNHSLKPAGKGIIVLISGIRGTFGIYGWWFLYPSLLWLVNEWFVVYHFTFLFSVKD